MPYYLLAAGVQLTSPGMRTIITFYMSFISSFFRPSKPGTIFILYVARNGRIFIVAIGSLFFPTSRRFGHCALTIVDNFGPQSVAGRVDRMRQRKSRSRNRRRISRDYRDPKVKSRGSGIIGGECLRIVGRVIVIVISTLVSVRAID